VKYKETEKLMDNLNYTTFSL